MFWDFCKVKKSNALLLKAKLQLYVVNKYVLTSPKTCNKSIQMNHVHGDTLEFCSAGESQQ